MDFSQHNREFFPTNLLEFLYQNVQLEAFILSTRYYTMFILSTQYLFFYFSPDGADFHQVPTRLDYVGGVGGDLSVGSLRRPLAMRTPQDPGGDGPGKKRADLPITHLLGRGHLLIRLRIISL